MHRLVNVIHLFIYHAVTKWSLSTALNDFDEVYELERTQYNQLDREEPMRMLRRRLNHDLNRGFINRHEAEVEEISHLNGLEQTQVVYQQNIDQPKQEKSSSSFLSGEDQTLIQVCQELSLDFTKATNGRKMSGGEFVGGEWYHGYGINIDAEGHDGKSSLHPMIFDSTDVESNGSLGSNDIFALGSPNSDCGGHGKGTGGKEGKPGENCKSLGNLLIPSRKPGSPFSNSISRERLYRPPLGGVLIFEFNKQTSIKNMGFLNTGGSDHIMVVHSNGNEEKIEVASLGQNGFQSVRLAIGDVKRLYVSLHSFGAVTGLDLCIFLDENKA